MPDNNNDKTKKVKCPACKCEGPFMIHRNLGALVCDSCGVFFMPPNVRETIRNQAESKIIAPGGQPVPSPFET